MNLSDSLRTYARAAVAAATAAWRARLPGLPLGEEAADWIGQPARLAALTDRLPLEAHRALRVLRRAGRATGVALAGELAVYGVPYQRALALIAELHGLMVLLPDDYVPQYARESAVQAGAIHLRLPDAWAEDPADPPPPASELPVSDPPTEARVLRGDCARAAVAMLEVQRLLAARPIRPTQGGWLARTQLGTVERALTDAPIDALGLVEWARAAGLLDEELRPARRLRFDEPMYLLAQELFAAWALRARGDGEALGGMGQEADLSWVTQLRRRALARLLGRLPAGQWMAAEEVARALNALVPSNLRPEHDPAAHFLGSSRVEARLLALARREVLPMLAALCALGALDLAGRFPARGGPPVEREAPAAAEGLWVRVTAWGQDLLSGAPSAAPIPTPALPITGLLLAAPTRPNSDLLYRLAWIAEFQPRRPEEPVQRAAITRNRWLEATHAGMDAAEALRWLAACSGRPLPPEARRSIEGWSAAARPVRLFTDHALARYATAEARDLAAAATPGAIPVGATDLLMRAPPAPVDWVIFDYRQAPPLLTAPGRGRIPATPLRIGAGRVVTVDPTRADLSVEATLARLTVETPAGRRLDMETIRRHRLERLAGQWIVDRLSGSPPLAEQAWLVANLGAPGQVHIHTPELLLLPPHLTRVLLQIPEARDLLIGALSEGALVIRPGARPDLERLLERLEIPAGTALPMATLEEIEGVGDQAARIALGREGMGDD